MSAPTLGVTLYSFTSEWVAGDTQLPGLIRAVASAGIGPGIEIVGFQSLRGFPRVGRETVRLLRGLFDELGLVPTCLGSNIDVALHTGRLMTDDEAVDYLLPQLEAARLLGFPVLRIQMGATPEVIRRVTPAAEAAGVTLGMEIHAPEHPTSPVMTEVRELYASLCSERLAFIPDFSATMRTVPPGMIAALRSAGLPAAETERLLAHWRRPGPPHERFAAFAAAAADAGADPALIAEGRLCFTIAGNARPGEWADLAGQVAHVHAKFFSIDENGNEPAIDYDANLAAIRETGFAGTISSEWEGHSYLDYGQADPYALIRRQHELIRCSWAATAPRPGSTR